MPSRRLAADALPEWLVSMVDMNPFHIEDYVVKRNLNYDGWKWYQHDDDMFKLSKAVPSLTFHLYGRGEDDFDIWKSTYKDGKSEQHEVVEIVYSDGTREKV